MELADRARSASPQKSPARRSKANVLEEQIAILRELNAPQHVIELAERVLREGLAKKEKEKGAEPADPLQEPEKQEK